MKTISIGLLLVLICGTSYARGGGHGGGHSSGHGFGHSSGAHESYHSSSPHIYGGSHGMIGSCSSHHRNEEEE